MAKAAFNIVSLFIAMIYLKKKLQIFPFIKI